MCNGGINSQKNLHVINSMINYIVILKFFIIHKFVTIFKNIVFDVIHSKINNVAATEAHL